MYHGQEDTCCAYGSIQTNFFVVLQKVCKLAGLADFSEILTDFIGSFYKLLHGIISVTCTVVSSSFILLSIANVICHPLDWAVNWSEMP